VNPNLQKNTEQKTFVVAKLKAQTQSNPKNPKEKW